MSKRIALFPALLLALLVIVATALTWMNFRRRCRAVSRAQAACGRILTSSSRSVSLQLVTTSGDFSTGGRGLGLVGVLFQQVLRNPLAETDDVGRCYRRATGDYRHHALGNPGAMASQFAALVGACRWLNRLWRRVGETAFAGYADFAGLVVSLYCGAISRLLVIFHHDQLQSMFLWSTGTLTQTDWGGVERLWPQLLGGVMLTLLLLRPLTLMGLDDGVARDLGLALSLARLAALSLAIVISALLVNAVGIIGFIGLFAPLLAKMLGARRLLPRLMLASLIGALILWLSIK
ncbi:iron chelate uptake ABC transporter family permease subunit [Escherichia coli]